MHAFLITILMLIAWSKLFENFYYLISPLCQSFKWILTYLHLPECAVIASLIAVCFAEA